MIDIANLQDARQGNIPLPLTFFSLINIVFVGYFKFLQPQPCPELHMWFKTLIWGAVLDIAQMIFYVILVFKQSNGVFALTWFFATVSGVFRMIGLWWAFLIFENNYQLMCSPSWIMYVTVFAYVAIFICAIALCIMSICALVLIWVFSERSSGLTNPETQRIHNQGARIQVI